MNDTETGQQLAKQSLKRIDEIRLGKEVKRCIICKKLFEYKDLWEIRKPDRYNVSLYSSDYICVECIKKYKGTRKGFAIKM